MSHTASEYTVVLFDNSLRFLYQRYFPAGTSGFVGDHVYPVPDPVSSTLESDKRYSGTTLVTDTPYGPVAPGAPS